MTIDNKALSANDYKMYFDKGISYAEYLSNFEAEIAIGEESKFAKYLPQNWQRQSRLDRKLKLQPQLTETLSQLSQVLKCLVITEHWCGDASQINPVFNKMALESDGLIDLKFIYRDENKELMNAHMTGGSSSIPILVILDPSYNLLQSYGPRPAEAQVLVLDLLAKGESYDIPVHTWYARDKQQTLQNELVELLSSL